VNTLELRLNGDHYEVTIVCEGITSWERFKPGIADEDILKKIKDKNYYQHKKGSWHLTIPSEYKMFKDDKFGVVITLALTYIYERDNPYYPDYFA